MKIAILVLDPCISGTVRWTEQVKAGLVAAGHEAWTISATKSGKSRVSWGRVGNGAQWWTRAPDVVVRHDQVAGYLDLFDLVIVNDVASSTLDGVRNANERPYYVDALMKTTTRWTTVAHGNSYDARHARFAPEVLSSPSFSGTIVAHPAPYAYESHELFRDLKRVEVTRPYVPVLPVDAPLPVGSIVGGMARFSGHKGLHVLGLSAMKRVTEVEIAGACMASARPCDAYMLWETLRNNDATGIYDGKKTQTTPYEVTTPIGGHVRYLGNYTDGVETAGRWRTFVSLTIKTFSAGCEYTLLEAMDAGCLPVASEHLAEEGYWMITSPEVGSAPLAAHAVMKNLDWYVDPVNHMLDRADSVSDEHRVGAVRYNRETLRRQNDATTIAQTILEAVI